MKLNSQLAHEANLLLPMGYANKVSNPFMALRYLQGDCIAAALLLKALSIEDESPAQLVRFTQIRRGLEPHDGTHFFCARKDRVLHMSGKVVDESVGGWLKDETSGYKHLAKAKHLYKRHGSSLGPANPTVTVTTNIKNGVASDRFAYIDEGELLDRVAPGKTMERLAELSYNILQMRRPEAMV